MQHIFILHFFHPWFFMVLRAESVGLLLVSLFSPQVWPGGARRCRSLVPCPSADPRSPALTSSPAATEDRETLAP